ncbi:MAG: hypothetical protein KatS3mg101_0852 [Patescibacteria group bacterium]|nr:MAG: hypothetical protein KatS3mg101_0852 [Patescibacteria group bacterium]
MGDNIVEYSVDQFIKLALGIFVLYYPVAIDKNNKISIKDVDVFDLDKDKEDLGLKAIIETIGHKYYTVETKKESYLNALILNYLLQKNDPDISTEVGKKDALIYYIISKDAKDFSVKKSDGSFVELTADDIYKIIIDDININDVVDKDKKSVMEIIIGEQGLTEEYKKALASAEVSKLIIVDFTFKMNKFNVTTALRKRFTLDFDFQRDIGNIVKNYVDNISNISPFVDKAESVLKGGLLFLSEASSIERVINNYLVYVSYAVKNKENDPVIDRILSKVKLEYSFNSIEEFLEAFAIEALTKENMFEKSDIIFISGEGYFALDKTKLGYSLHRLLTKIGNKYYTDKKQKYLDVLSIKNALFPETYLGYYKDEGLLDEGKAEILVSYMIKKGIENFHYNDEVVNHDVIVKLITGDISPDKIIYKDRSETVIGKLINNNNELLDEYNNAFSNEDIIFNMEKLLSDYVTDENFRNYLMSLDDNIDPTVLNNIQKTVEEEYIKYTTENIDSDFINVVEDFLQNEKINIPPSSNKIERLIYSYLLFVQNTNSKQKSIFLKKIRSLVRPLEMEFIASINKLKSKLTFDEKQFETVYSCQMIFDSLSNRELEINVLENLVAKRLGRPISLSMIKDNVKSARVSVKDKNTLITVQF